MTRKITIFSLLLQFIIISANAQQLLYTLQGNGGKVNTVQFSPDGKILLSGNQDGSIKAWDVANNFKQTTSVNPIGESITNISFSTDAKEIGISSYKSFFIYGNPTLKKLKAKKKAHTTFVRCANFSKSGEYVVSTSWRDNTIVIWKRSSLKVEKVLPETVWTDYAMFINDDKQIVSINHENTIKVWDVASGNLMQTFAGHTDWVYGILLSPDGKYLLSGSLDNSIKKWDLNTGKIVQTIEAHKNGITWLASSADGKYFISSSLDKTAKLWSWETMQEIAQFSGHDEAVLEAVISPDNKYIATGSLDKTIKIWAFPTSVK
jgi:WD40 repeat protein